MEIVKFKEHNTIYAKDQEEYLQLPVFRREDGEITSCWAPSFKERLIILFTGKIWLNILTFNQPLQPLKLLARKPLMEEEK